MSEWKKKDCTTLQGAANRIGVKRDVIQEWVDSGLLESQNGLVQLKSIETIKNELERYVSMETYLYKYALQNDLFRYKKNQDEYLLFLQENNFFGIEAIFQKDFPYPYDHRATLFFEKKDLIVLDEKSKDFFRFFGKDEKEKCRILINECHYDTTKKLLNAFLKERDTYTPIVTEFVKNASNIDIKTIKKEEDIHEIIKTLFFEGSKDLMTDFMKYADKKLSLNLGEITHKKNTTTREIGAYPYKTYVTIAKALFNEENITLNHVIEKSLEKSIVFETWLYLSIHYTSGWRNPDIEKNWKYLSDERVKKYYGEDLEKLKNDIIQGKIDSSFIYQIGVHIEKSIELSAELPGKVQGKKTSDLMAPIGEELKYFFGRMALISAYHHIKNGEGRLDLNRKSEYLNFVRFKEIFGDSVYKLNGRRNLCHNRLLKSYLQGLEECARELGMGTMTAYTIAQYARNHSNIDTTATYLRDNGLSGENADVVLSLMFDSGVFGTINYTQILLAYPEAYKKLSVREQTMILAECGLSAYELEMMCSELETEMIIKRDFAEGNKEKPVQILNEMFRISQGFGKAKDYGTYCKKRALGIACEMPTIECCVAEMCPHLIFTEAGIKSLLEVLKIFKEKANMGNPKYENILNKKLIPTYKEILAEVSNRNPSIKNALKEGLEKYHATDY